jgi:5-hydroxyisourate hydrolase
MTVTTHVLDLAAGRPAAGVPVRLEVRDERGWRRVAEATTDDDGRAALGDPGPGVCRLTFAVDTPLYPEVVVTFRIDGGRDHVPLLLSPYGYTTYRGS